MTWLIGSTRVVTNGWWLWLCASACVAMGCDGVAVKGTLELVDPPNEATITRADDVVAGREGVQYDVRATSTRIDAGEEVELVVGGEVKGSGAIDDDGNVAFEGVTLPPGVKKIFVRTLADDDQIVSDQDHQYTLRALVITDPVAGEQTDDEPDKEGFQLAVTVEAYEVEDNIRLEVDGEADATQAQRSNSASFVVDLEPGEHTLAAFAGDIESDRMKVEIPEEGDDATPMTSQDCQNIDLVFPTAPEEGDSITLGGDDCPSDGDFEIDVTIATDAGDGLPATLTVNADVAETVEIGGTIAHFAGVTLDRRDSANRLSVSVATDDGSTCTKDFDLNLNVDCAGPDCSITSPTPLKVTSGSDTTLYLNTLAGDGAEFDIGVATSGDAVGETVRLIVDGDTRDPLKVEAVKDGDNGTATFADLELSEGEHTIEALCVDGDGNPTYSAPHTWTVDVTPCSVEVDSPAEDFIFAASDDDDGTTDGTQVLVEATVGGADCSQARAAVCDPADGISGTPFTAYAGAPFSVTLDDSTRSQSLCVEVADRAGNTSSTEVAVGFIPGAPELAFLSPSDDTYYNATGVDGASTVYEPDEDDSTPVCEASFRVQCSEIGVDVTLTRAPGESDETVIGSEPCETPGASDDDVAAGYGLAVFGQVDFLADVVGTGATFAATQTVSASNGDLSGSTMHIDLEGDCEPPSVSSPGGGPLIFTLASASETLGSCPQIAMAPSADPNAFEIVSLDSIQASLTLTPIPSGAPDAGADAPITTVRDSLGSGFRFDGIVLGTVQGSATADLTLTDGFNNSTTLPTCTVAVLDDPPELAPLVACLDGSDCPPTSPVTGFTVATAKTLCPGDAGTGQFLVPVLFSPDKTDATRALSYSVDGGASVPVPLGSVSAPVCVPIPEGGSTISATLSTLNDVGSVLGSELETLSLSLSTLRLDAPVPGTEYYTTRAPDPGCNAVEAKVSVAVDDIYPNNEPVTITRAGTTTDVINGLVNGATNTVEACVPLEQGTQTITVEIESTGAMESVSVAASLTDVQTTTLTGLSLALPPADNPTASDTYRSSPGTLSWALPPGTFFWTDYQLRCSATEMTSGTASGPWWDAATEVVAPMFDATPPEAGTEFYARIGQAAHCVLRACDVSGGCTAMPTTSTLIHKPFRYQLILPPTAPDADSPTYLGSNATPVGDVNGDGLEDVLLAGGNPLSASGVVSTSEAYLYFGRNMSPSHASETTPTADTPDVIFRENRPFFSTVALGVRMAGLGDINGDGISDFAIASAYHCEGCDSTRDPYAYGAVFVYFGRASGDKWLTDPLNDTTNVFDLSSCQADVCIYGFPDATRRRLGSGLVGIGGFDSDELNDVAIGSRVGPGYGAVYVLSGRSFVDLTCGAGAEPCDRPANLPVWGVSKILPDDGAEFTGYQVFGDETAGYGALGYDLVAVGDMDPSQDGLDDLVVVNRSRGTNPSALLLLTGREWLAAPGLQSLPVSDLETIVLDDPSAQLPLVTGAVALGNVYDPPCDSPPCATTGVPDLGLYNAINLDLIQVYPGDLDLPGGFDPSSGIRVGPVGGQVGRSACSGEFPALGLRDFTDSTPDRHLDLDSDGLADMCLGSLIPQPGTPWIVYGSRLSDLAVGAQVGLELFDDVSPPEAIGANAWLRTMQYVGDITGDGAPDLVVGDKPQESSGAAEKQGGAWVLY